MDEANRHLLCDIKKLAILVFLQIAWISGRSSERQPRDNYEGSDTDVNVLENNQPYRS